MRFSRIVIPNRQTKGNETENIRRAHSLFRGHNATTFWHYFQTQRLKNTTHPRKYVQKLSKEGMGGSQYRPRHTASSPPPPTRVTHFGFCPNFVPSEASTTCTIDEKSQDSGSV